MAVSVVSSLLKRLTFVNWDKTNSNIFHIDNNRVQTSAACSNAFRRTPVRPGSVRRRS